MVKIRLKRLGYKKNPFYRIVVTESSKKVKGKPIAEIGTYNPKTKEMKLNKVLVEEWIKKGAKPSETVEYLIKNSDENGNLIYKKSKEQKLSKKALAKLEAEKAAKEEAAKAAKEAKAAAEQADEVAADAQAEAGTQVEAVEQEKV